MTIAARIYDRKIEPIERASLAERRRRLLSGLEGAVLELGAGTGRSLPYYEAADEVVLVEPNPELRELLEQRLPQARVPVAVVDALAEELPFPNETFDTVVMVLVLCSVDRPDLVLAEARRVLKQGGRLLLVEHVRAGGAWGCFQDLTSPLHRFVSCGCAPNRRTAQAVRNAGFELSEERFPLHGASPLGRPAIEGIALKR
jgi:ubiquinone/menaquinone biosynthesis C-methylase UbiE